MSQNYMRMKEGIFKKVFKNDYHSQGEGEAGNYK